VKKLIILLLSLYLLPAAALANENQCFNADWPVTSYTHKSRGEVIIYRTPETYNITSTNLACVAAIQVVEHRKKMPKKMLVGLISQDYRRAFLAQWSFSDDRFVIIEVNIPSTEYKVNGVFITFPEPLARLREMMVVEKFPKVEDLPTHLQHKYKINYLPTTLMQLKSIVETDGNFKSNLSTKKD